MTSLFSSELCKLVVDAHMDLLSYSRKRRTLGCVKNGKFIGGFGHQVHIVNQKLDLERLIGMVR